ncbi:MAG: M42 family metallopeptidase [Clostridia bacterium]|nr:M42 family metallopeptidase [Clostridia bacterium]
MEMKAITQCWGPSGREGKISELIKSEAEKYADEVYTDALGNLIAHKKGSEKKIMLAAHMDEIGVVVTYIDENGFLRFSNIGGVYIKRLLNRRVEFANGVIGVIDTESDNKEMKLSKMFIDIGASTKAEAESKVSVGDMAVFVGDYIETDSVIISKALDNRIGCAALLEVMERASGDNDVYFCFTAQEEVGLRGAKAVAYSVAPEYALAVDVTDTGDTPSADKMAVKLGGGAAVKVMDRSVICNADVRSLLIELAKRDGIPYQLEVMTDGGTDAGAIHTSRDGVKTGGVSIPTRYIHSPSEMASKADYNAAVKLLTAFCEYKF